MRLVYLTDAAIPSRATNAMQVMHMCAAFQRVGAAVTLVRPWYVGVRPEGYRGDLWEFYGVDPTFGVTTLPTPVMSGLTRFGRLARAARAIPLAGYVSWRGRPSARAFTCYTRSFLGAWLTVQSRRGLRGSGACKSVVLELHDVPRDGRAWQLLRAVDGIVTISDALRTSIIARAPDLAGKTWVEHDGVDLAAALPDLEPTEARQQLGLNIDGARVLAYTGRVNAGKGIEVVLSAADQLGTLGIHLLVVGKVYDQSCLALARGRSNITLTGFVPPSDVSLYLAASDFLVMPTTPRLAYSAFTSPLKLFEYMASGRPIVAANLPSVREVLASGVNALLYEPECAGELVDAVRSLIADDCLSTTLAARAREDVAQYSWDERARRIMTRIRLLATSRVAGGA